MVWIVAALAGLFIVYLAARFSRFQRLAEPALTIAVAAALVAAFVVWFNDDSAESGSPVPDIAQGPPAIVQQELALSDVTIVQGSTDTTHHLTATIRNNSTLALDYFTLVVTMQDCPNDVCTPVGEDETLILARLAAGQSEIIRTTLTFPVSKLAPPTAIRWDYRIEKIRTVR